MTSTKLFCYLHNYLLPLSVECRKIKGDVIAAIFAYCFSQFLDCIQSDLHTSLNHFFQLIFTIC